MIHACSFCKTVTGIDDEKCDNDALRISHGICEECSVVFIENAESGKPTNPAAILAARGIADVSYRTRGADHGPSCQRT